MPERDVFSVARLNRAVKNRLESGFRTLWVEGELSNLRRPGSGHWYFTLKDDKAQVRCAMFAGRNRLVDFTPADGQRVIVRSRLTVYEPRGEYQLQVEEIEEAGEGALRRAFEALKKKLAAEGLFDAARKRPLPSLPQRIGVITSDSGAAVRDVLKVLRTRFPAVPVLVYPVAVQGDRAPGEIVKTLQLACERADCDVLILTRGGGSLEDLWAFNDERVVRAVAAATIPIICGVGHEIDFTIADFAADQRAPTPSAAAEMVVPDAREWLRNLRAAEQQLHGQMRRGLQRRRERLAFVERRLQQQHPGRRLAHQAQRLDELEHRLTTAWQHQLHRRRARIATLDRHLRGVSPARQLATVRERLARVRLRMGGAASNRVNLIGERLRVAARALDAVSPLATLDRGYAIVSVKDRDQRRIVRDASELQPGTRVEAEVAHGIIEAEVIATKEKN
ncbi:MAG: exodeoxyribonuclease VII large subunit [Gammaproteobacteria bacterium]|nr:exodeoxyribonuclease VII large subunit [Gammaproteobacteria bacterium]